MKITALRHWLVHLPFSTDLVWSSGRRSGSTRLIVEITTESGLKGYGETICLHDFVEPVLTSIVAPLALGREISDVERLYKHVLGAGYSSHKRAAVMAVAAIEMAMWDALGKRAGLPLFALWGGRYRNAVDIAAFLPAGPPDEIQARALAFQKKGYRAFKVKIGLDLVSDITMVRAAREALGAGVNLRADVNGAWTTGTARRQLAKLAEYDLSYIEQPLELGDFLGHAELRRNQPVPVALDESAYDLVDVGNIVRMGAADVILIDPHEAGGLWACLKEAAVAESAGIPVTLHAGGELGLSQAAYLHLAAAIPNMTIPIDSEYSYLGQDVIRARHEIRNGAIAVPTAPGLGVEVDVSALDAHRIDKVPLAYLDSQRPDWFPEKPAY